MKKLITLFCKYGAICGLLSSVYDLSLVCVKEYGEYTPMEPIVSAFDVDPDDPNAQVELI